MQLDNLEVKSLELEVNNEGIICTGADRDVWNTDISEMLALN